MNPLETRISTIRHRKWNVAAMCAAVVLLSAAMYATADCEHCDGCGSGPCKKDVSQQCEKCAAKNLKLARESFLAGLAEIRKDDWAKALELYRKAASIETRFKKVFTRQSELLETTLRDRAVLAKKQLTPDDLEKARQCWRFCVIRKAFVPATDIAEKLRQASPSVESDELLADTYMMADKNEQACEILTAVATDKLSAKGKLIYGIACARTGKAQQADAILAEIDGETVPAGLKFKYAMLLAQCGEKLQAVSVLRSIVENSCGMGVKRLKCEMEKTEDFASLRSLPEYKAMMQIQRPCCRNCPHRANCKKMQNE